ncbi:TPR domain-containing protein [Xylaria bambusicola]|uniref:TPR domain-containing protein n=1 Tax=Xylaria bambusicola TaxID=326684 RepID=UPI0020083827|nr:TPR domain-containing protein [Xylaria bambusicola]KAI0521835.1 TPR domain-containing protein [Xylaria bambusicola]
MRSENIRRQERDVLAILRLLHKRHQSSSAGKNATDQQPPMPPSKLIFRALRQGLSFRPLLHAIRGQNLRTLFRQSPEELVIAIIILCACAGVSVYVVYSYFNYFQSEQFTRFPPDIAKSLRRALYYTNYSPDPKLALKYYKLALEQCTAAGLDPFSDEVIGVRIQLAAWLEKIGKYQNSIEVLEALLRDCKRWVEKMEKSVQDGFVDKAGRLISAAIPKAEPPKEGDDGAIELPENLWAKRTRVLGKSVGISVKLGELYADEHVLQGDAAGEHLIWSVETVLKELQRRQVEGVKEGEGDWMTPEQIGGALEALGNHYESKSQHYLSAPLYLQAVSLSPPNSCHTAVLMNNLAISLAQQPVQSPFQAAPAPGAGKQSQPANATPTRATLLASARQWALQALGTAQKVTGEGRTEECDEACAVAMCNLGDIAAMAGDVEEAKRRFRESLELSQKLSFEPGMIQAKDGLKRLSSTKSAKD